MTSQQQIMLEFFRTVRSLSGEGGSKNLLIAAQIKQLLDQYPFASEVKTELRNGEVYILDCDSKIYDIVGYTPEELKGQPLTKIMSGKLDHEKQSIIMHQLTKYGMSIKTNTNLCKDGNVVNTFGWIFNVGENAFREVVMDAKHIVGYDVGVG